MGYKETFPTIKSLADSSGQHGKVANRRTTVLAKLFMRHITDQMSTGDIAAKIYGHNIEISKVCKYIKFTTWFIFPTFITIQLLSVKGYFRFPNSKHILVG